MIGFKHIEFTDNWSTYIIGSGLALAKLTTTYPFILINVYIFFFSAADSYITYSTYASYSIYATWSTYITYY